MDINKLWLSGEAVTNPTQETLGGKTKLSFFILKIKEKYYNRKKEKVFHESFVKIESLGKASYNVMDTVKKGGRYMVDGYLRQDRIGNRDDVRARTFAVYPDESDDGHSHSSGLVAAFNILESSMDIESAREKLAVLIKHS